MKSIEKVESLARDDAQGAFEEHPNSLKEAPLGQMGQFFLNGEAYKAGSWVKVNFLTLDVPKSVKYFFQGYRLPASVQVVLNEGRKIIVEVSSDWDKDIYPPQQMLHTRPPTTIPSSNAAFYYEEPDPMNKRKRTITCLKEAEISGNKLGSYEENLALLDASKKVSVERHISSETESRLKNILTEEAGLDEQTLEEIRMVQLLSRITQFIDQKTPGEDIRGLEDMHVEYLLNQYDKNGSFPGTCKSSATLVASLCEVLGLPSRIVFGSLISPEERFVAYHGWAEVYIPSIRRWAPIDPATGALFIYPSDKLIYCLEGEILPKEGVELKIKVDYYDQA